MFFRASILPTDKQLKLILLLLNWIYNNYSSKISLYSLLTLQQILKFEKNIVRLNSDENNSHIKWRKNKSTHHIVKSTSSDKYCL